MTAWALMLPLPAVAYDFSNPYKIYDLTNPNNTLNPQNKHVCAINDDQYTNDYEKNMQEYGLTKRIVLCVKETILSAVYKILVPFSDYFSKLIAIMCTLAVAVFSVQMIAGRRSPLQREAILFGVKIGAVILFTSNFGALYFDPPDADGNTKYGGLFGLILDAIEDLLSMVVQFVTISTSFNCETLSKYPALALWDTVDCALDTLVGGIFSPLGLSHGIIGFLIAALLSNVLGFFIAILGFVLVVMFLLAVARAMYIFISGYIAFALMVLISPMIIPLILFKSTKAFFEKWLRLTLGFILQPVFIFVYLSMLVAAYDVIVFSGPRSFFRSITGFENTQTEYYKNIGQWMLDRGYYQTVTRGQVSGNMDYSVMQPRCIDAACETNNTLSKQDSGTFGVIGKHMVDTVTAWQGDIYDQIGDKERNSPLFMLKIPLTGINWHVLTLNSYWYLTEDEDWTKFLDIAEKYTAYDLCQRDPVHNAWCGPDRDPYNWLGDYYFPYLIGVILSAIMAVATTFIFMTLLRVLPFIGSGISGESLSLPTFGVGKMAPPGENKVTDLSDNLSKNFFKR